MEKKINDSPSSDVVNHSTFLFDKYSSSFKDLCKITLKELYWIIWKHNRKKQIPAAMVKWNNVFELTDKKWKSIFLTPFRTFKSTFFQDFQYKIVHRLIPCQHRLYTLKISDSPHCLYCDEDDTIIHFFYECPVIKRFWSCFKRWWQNISNCALIINNFVVMFGITVRDKESINLNYCLILAKYFIFLNRIQRKTVFDFKKFLSYLEYKLNEEYQYYINSNQCPSCVSARDLIRQLI